MTVSRGLKYPSGSVQLGFDLYRPGDAPAPLIVFLHGGGWISGDRGMYDEEAEWFAAHGFASATIDYRLAPLYPYPAAVNDVQTFVEFARCNAEDLGIKPSKIGSFGNSAGGHLSLLLGLARSTPEGGFCKPVDAFVAVCGISDLRPAEGSAELASTFIEQFMGGPHSERKGDYVAASPICHPPVCGHGLLFHGEADDIVPVEQSRALAARLKDAGNDVGYFELPGEQHSFSFHAWGSIRDRSLEFFQRCLG